MKSRAMISSIEKATGCRSRQIHHRDLFAFVLECAFFFLDGFPRPVADVLCDFVNSLKIDVFPAVWITRQGNSKFVHLNTPENDSLR
jgi:hypothetical protein